MSTVNALAKQLSSADSDINFKIKVAAQLSNNIEHYISGPIYAEFLKKLVPIFINCLNGPPVFNDTFPEQKLRNRILTILYQLPKDSPRPFELDTEDIVGLLINLMRIDNEENASLCIKIIRGIIQHHAKVLRDKLQPLLGLIKDMSDQMNLVVTDQLDYQVPHVSTPGMSRPESSQTHDKPPRSGSATASISDFDLKQPALPLPRAMASLNVLGECFNIVQSVFKSSESLESLDVNFFFHHIKSILLLQAKPQEQAHAAAAAEGTIFTGVSPNIGNRAAFGELIGTQAKALSLLEYMLRSPISKKKLFKRTKFKHLLPNLPYIGIRLLKDCPCEKSAVRKELLHAIRSIVNHNFTRIFLKHIDELLDERTLLGDGLTVYETLRPLAYGVLADIIHHVRDALEPPQIRKIVEFYTKNLQDNCPGTSFQTMSAKLLLSMAECIAKMPNKADARYYLILILNAIGNKFVAMKQQHSNAVKLSKLYAQLSNDASPYSYLADKESLSDWDEIDIFTAMPIKTSNPLDHSTDPVADNKFLFKNLINGLDDIFYQLKTCQIGSSIRFTAEEVQVISKLFREGARVFCYYKTDRPAADSQHISALEVIVDCSISGTEEGKDMLKTFMAVLHHVDPMTLHEIFYNQIQGRDPQLSEILPTLIQQHHKMNYLETLFNIPADSHFDLLIWSVLDIEKGVHQTRNSSIRVAERKDLTGPLQKIWLAAIEPFQERIDDEWVCVDATSGLCMEPSVERIINAILVVEDAIQRTQHSTFRAVYYKHCNHSPQEVYSFLISKIKEMKYGRFLAQTLEYPEGGPLRKVVVENIGKLIQISGDVEAEQASWYTAVINTVHIIHSLCKFKECKELMEEEDIIIWLKMVAKNLEAYLRADMLPSDLRLAAEQASEQLMVVFTKFLEHHPTDLDALFSLIESVANDDFRQTRPFLAYIYPHIICNESIEYQKTIILRGLEVYADEEATQRTKSYLLHNFISPIVAMDVMRMSKEETPKNSRLIDKTIIKSISEKIWKIGFDDSNDDLTGIDHTRFEALQLTATLVKYHYSVFQGVRKDIIKFGWAQTRLEDVINKQAAYVVIGYCIAHYEIPANFIQQVFLSLLKTNQDAGRALVTQALELIATTFPNKCNAVSDDPNSVWAVIPLRILTEERQHVQQMTTVLSFLVKHASYYYEHRDKFIIPIVKSLRAIAPLPNCSSQSKKLVLQFMTLVWQWEQQRVEGEKFRTPEKRKLENSDAPEYVIPAWTRAEMVTYLVEFIVSLRTASPQSANAGIATASLPPSAEMINSMSILHSLFHPRYWGDVDIDSSNIIEILLAGDPMDDKWVKSMMKFLQIVRIIADVNPQVLKSMPLLEKLLEMSQKSDNSEICACLHDEADINDLKMKSLWSVGVSLEFWR